MPSTIKPKKYLLKERSNRSFKLKSRSISNSFKFNKGSKLSSKKDTTATKRKVNPKLDIIIAPNKGNIIANIFGSEKRVAMLL